MYLSKTQVYVCHRHNLSELLEISLMSMLITVYVRECRNLC